MSFSQIFVALLLIVFTLHFQACSNSGNSSSPANSPMVNNQPIEIKTLGGLSVDDSGILSLSRTGLKWRNLKDKVSNSEFYRVAYQKGCTQVGQPQETLQVDNDLKPGQSFKSLLLDVGQDYHLTIAKKRTVLEANKSAAQVVFSTDFLGSSDSRIQDYTGPVVLENPYEKLRMGLVKSQLTDKPIVQTDVLESKLHPDLLAKLSAASGAWKIDCRLKNNSQTSEIFSLGEVTLKNGPTVKANKKTQISLGTVVCQRIEDAPFSTKNEFEKIRGDLVEVGPGKNVHMIISSNQLPSAAFNFCGGAQLLDFKLLVLDDGRVLQQRIDLVDEILQPGRAARN